MSEKPEHHRIVVPAGHPALPGHFPGNPLVPGALLLDLVAQAISEVYPGKRIVKAKWFKFARPVTPDQTVVVEFSPRGDDMNVTGKAGGLVVLSGLVTLKESAEDA